MSLLNLGIHSFSIIAVFKSQVFLRGFIFGILIYLFKNLLGNLLIYLILALIIFLALIYLNSFRRTLRILLNQRKTLIMLKHIHTKRLYFESVLESKVNQNVNIQINDALCVDIFY